VPQKPSSTERLEAFSDGVIAVIITIMVLELKVPHQDGTAGLYAILPILLIYLLSFAFTGIYWINHQHLVERIESADVLFFTLIWAFFSAYLCCHSSLPMSLRRGLTPLLYPSMPSR
jgi:TMEM175 potassium channel family protein